MSDPNLPPEQPDAQPPGPMPPGGEAPPPVAPPPPPAAPPPPPPPGYAAPPPAAPPPAAPPPPPPGYGAAPPPAYGAAPPPPPPARGEGPFSVGDAFSWGWNKFQANAGPIIIAALIFFVILVVFEIIYYVIFSGIFLTTASITVDQTTGEISTTGGSGFFAALLFGALGAFVFFVLAAFLQAAIVRGALSIANGNRLELSTMLTFDRMGPILVGALIVALLTAVGYLLCFVGAVVVAFFTPFWLFFVLDKDQDGWSAVKSSFSLVNQNLGQVFVLILGVIAAYIVGALLCGIGLIVTIPVAILAETYAFRRLQNEPIAA